MSNKCNLKIGKNDVLGLQAGVTIEQGKGPIYERREKKSVQSLNGGTRRQWDWILKQDETGGTFNT